MINDINADLMSVYETIKTDVDSLIASLKTHQNSAEYFYALRNLDRDKAHYQALSKVERASRFIYLNKTCFNGLFRVNSANEFNVPFGRYKNPNIVNEPALRAMNLYFQKNDVKLFSEDFALTLERVPKDSFVYIDPPYDPISETANFTNYHKGGFDKAQQKRLKECCDELHRKGVRFLLSNSATPFIMELYGEYKIHTIQAKRAISAKSSARGVINEVLVRNYEP
ncbi:MAG: DNA adenine methylase [Wolinella sp.]